MLLGVDPDDIALILTALVVEYGFLALLLFTDLYFGAFLLFDTGVDVLTGGSKDPRRRSEGGQLSD